jgi:ribosomal protein L40E
MTSNIGSQKINQYSASGMGFKMVENKKKGLSINDIRGDIEKQLRIKLSPEFMNRIDEIVIFNPLSKEDLKKITSILLSQLKVKIEANQDVIDFLANTSYDPTMGARPLRRTIENQVVDPLASEIIKGEISEHDIIKLELSDGKITFKAKHVVIQNDIDKQERINKEKVKEKEIPSLKKEVPGKPVSKDEEPPEAGNKNSEPDKNKEILKTKTCRGCGAINHTSDRWCWKCGRDLR